VKRLAIGLLGAWRRAGAWWLRLRGRTPEGEAARRLASGEAWNEFCDTLKAAGATMHFPGAPTSELDFAEGHRYLTRLVRAGLEAFVEHADPRAPTLHRVVHETVKMGADNPDNHYLTARLDGALEYRIRGVRNTVHWLGFSTHRGHYGRGGGLPPTGHLEGSALEIAADGSFEIVVSPRPHPGNWLPTTSDSGTLIVRQTFLDRANERPADLSIELLSERHAPTTLSALRVEEGLRDTATLVVGASLLFAKWARDFQAHTNRLPRFDPETSLQAGGDPNIAYYHSHWSLAPDEALVIDLAPPPCATWNFQLNNYWMESLDYRFFTISLNKHTAVAGPDGHVRLVVAHEDPGVANWLTTAGHTSGTMCLRWVRADAHPDPRTRVVKLAQVRDA
jgi:hypothetical protein